MSDRENNLSATLLDIVGKGLFFCLLIYPKYLYFQDSSSALSRQSLYVKFDPLVSLPINGKYSEINKWCFNISFHFNYYIVISLGKIAKFPSLHIDYSIQLRCIHVPLYLSHFEFEYFRQKWKICFESSEAF